MLLELELLEELLLELLEELLNDELILEPYLKYSLEIHLFRTIADS